MSSDAIIVVKKKSSQENVSEEARRQEAYQESPYPVCLYSNSKGIELFNRDLTKEFSA